MVKEFFKHTKFNDTTRALISECVEVGESYQSQGFRLTLRQLYYQLVVRNTVQNTERSYQRLSRTVSSARLAGLIDWGAIEDRTREPKMPQQWRSPEQLMEVAIQVYRLPRWDGQQHHVELWVEKDALAGVLQPIATQYHIPLMVNRGYSSQTAMHDAYERVRDAVEDGKEATILYLGDLDPSGEDMVRDIDDRLNDLFGTEATVRKLGITPEQVEEYQPPPNPAKMTDSRAAKFVEEHGYNSYEVDALPPDVLRTVIDDAIDVYIDHDVLDDVIEQEATDKKLMREAVDEIMKSRDGDNSERSVN